MPPKKGGKKKGKGKGKGRKPGTEPLTPEDELRLAKLRIEALENLLVTRSEQTARAQAACNELRSRVSEYNADFDAERDDRHAITADMARQYKAMQETLAAKNRELESRIREQEDMLDKHRIALDETRREKDQLLSVKDAEIAEHKQKMEDMSIEFGDMLKETLDKMSERIELTKTGWDGDQAGAARGKLDEFNLGHVDV
eukprot:TRINITY_DN942_c0_g2_i1.p3 TRINITY_DN942_c0_g2~~TRINITY_DN942_c0_g2_i1.p3  ORF type:complete len:224 (+),score=152.92 TRINITY_DN942_c0_g2_i1:75-674(+)